MNWKWERITIDFRRSLPKTLRKSDSIGVIIDRATKSDYFISVRVDYDNSKLVKIYLKYGVPISIVSNRGTLFTSNFWEKFQSKL